MVDIIKTKGKKRIYYSTVELLLNVCYIVLLFLILTYNLMRSLISPGVFAASFNTVNQLSNATGNFMNSVSELKVHDLFINDYWDFMKSDDDLHPPKIEITEIQSIKFENVSFSYEDSKTFALKELNFEITKSDKVAFVGLNGSGKSTIINLMLGLYMPKQGKILINGYDFNDINKESLYSLSRVIFQNEKLYNLPIIENIVLDSVDNEDYTTINIARKSLDFFELSNKINGMKNGLFTSYSNELDEDGSFFSGGECQKNSLAKALDSSKKLILLDEPTKNLDITSSKKIVKYLFNKQNEQTVVFITHNLTEIVNADCIFFLENGALVEKGSHIDLMKISGKYYDLYQSQINLKKGDQQIEP